MFSQRGKGGALPLSCIRESPWGKALTAASGAGKALVSALRSKLQDAAPWEGSVHYCAVNTSRDGSIAARGLSPFPAGGQHRGSLWSRLRGRVRSLRSPCSCAPGEAGAKVCLMLPLALRLGGDLGKWHLTKRISALGFLPISV